MEERGLLNNNADLSINLDDAHLHAQQVDTQINSNSIVLPKNAEVKYTLPSSAWQEANTLDSAVAIDRTTAVSILRKRMEPQKTVVSEISIPISVESHKALAKLSGSRLSGDAYQDGAFQLPPIYKYLSVPSAAICAYHGYKRNKSIFWAAMWAMGGSAAPVFWPVIAFAQGFGKEKEQENKK